MVLGAVLGAWVGSGASRLLFALLFALLLGLAGHLFDVLARAEPGRRGPSRGRGRRPASTQGGPGPRPSGSWRRARVGDEFGDEPGAYERPGGAPIGRVASREDGRSEALAERLCPLFAAVAAADGAVGREEVRVARRFFEGDLRFGALDLEPVRRQLKAAIAHPPDPAQAARRAREQLQPSERLSLLDALFELAAVDGPLDAREREALRAVAKGLDIPEEDRRAIASLFMEGADDSYAHLGIEPDASDDEVRRSFRRLAVVHHPDKVAHLGEVAVAAAQRRFQALQEAYEAIRKARGI